MTPRHTSQFSPMEEEKEKADDFGGIDPNLAALMGFSGFGSTKG